MAHDPDSQPSRRRLLAAAVGGAAALVTEHLATPGTVSAVPAPVLTETDNASTALTSITQGTADVDAFKATTTGDGVGVEGESTTGIGVTGHAGTGIGVNGFGDSAGSVGLMAIGSLGAWIEGPTGAFIVSDSNLNGLQVHVGTGSSAPLPPANTAIFASVTSVNQVGLEAWGRIRFPNRSGRALIAGGTSSVSVTVPGVSSANMATATLNANRSGRWVRAVVCSAGKITIYLNTTVTSATYVAWLVLG